MAKTRILIVDDHEVLREGLRSLITRMRPEWEICGEATDGDEAIQLTQDLQPDIVVLDITMPRMSGLEASSRLRRKRIGIPVLIFTTHHSDRLAAEVQEAGAQGYVLKSEAARNLVLAVDSILAGGTFFGSASKPETAKDKSSKSGPFLCLDVAFEV